MTLRMHLRQRIAARAATAALVAAGAGMLAACTPAAPDTPEGRYKGIEVKPAKPKLDFALTDVQGQPFAFRAATDGRVTLLFFGYTACPDICPVHMANIAAVMARLSPGERERIRVVFVTTDPERDTPERLRTWLAHFDPTFIGVRGPRAEVNRIEASFGLAASFDDAESASDTTYGVGHAAQILAFTPDDSLRVMYPFGTRQQDWAVDLPRLMRYGTE